MTLSALWVTTYSAVIFFAQLASVYALGLLLVGDDVCRPAAAANVSCIAMCAAASVST